MENNHSPFRHDKTASYWDLKSKTLLHSPDPMKRLQFAESGNKLADTLLCKLEIAQQAMYDAKNEDNPEIVIKAGDLDLLFRGFADTVSHMQPDLPLGVYNYIHTNLSGFLELTVKQVHQSKMNRGDHQ
jgi:hypothetical protein